MIFAGLEHLALPDDWPLLDYSNPYVCKWCKDESEPGECEYCWFSYPELRYEIDGIVYDLCATANRSQEMFGFKYENHKANWCSICNGMAGMIDTSGDAYEMRYGS